jgi:hypothetical protein
MLPPPLRRGQEDILRQRNLLLKALALLPANHNHQSIAAHPMLSASHQLAQIYQEKTAQSSIA